MEEREDKKKSGQMKNLLIRVWEILREAGQDRPMSLEDIRAILIKQDRASRIFGEGEEGAKDKYNPRLLRANVKAINAALMANKKYGFGDRINKKYVGRREDKKCLYYNEDALSYNELRFVFDAVQSTAVLSQEEADGICRKLVALCGDVDRNLWHERVCNYKAEPYNNNVLNTINKAEWAIAHNRRVKFCVQGRGVDGGIISHDEIMDPIAVLYDSGRYHLYGYSKASENRCAFSIDRMRCLVVTDETSDYTKERESFLSSEGGGKDRLFAFGLNTIENPIEVTLRVHARLAPDMYDKFGANIKVSPGGPDHLLFNQYVNLTPEFYLWCASYGGELKIVLPDRARVGYAEYLLKMIMSCRKDDLLAAREKLKNYKNK